MLLVTEKWDLFKAGVKIIYSKWTALQMVLHETNFLAKEQELLELTLEFFQTQKVEIHELEDNLVEFVDYTFDAAFEDGSCKLVASDVCNFFESLMRDDMSIYEQLINLNAVELPAMPENSDDEEEEDVKMEEDPKPKPEKIIDEDGFELVQKKRR